MRFLKIIKKKIKRLTSIFYLSVKKSLSAFTFPSLTVQNPNSPDQSKKKASFSNPADFVLKTAESALLSAHRQQHSVQPSAEQIFALRSQK